MVQFVTSVSYINHLLNAKNFSTEASIWCVSEAKLMLAKECITPCEMACKTMTENCLSYVPFCFRSFKPLERCAWSEMHFTTSCFRPCLLVSWAGSGQFQVWPLTQFFLFPFCGNSLICLQINDPSLRKNYSFPFLPATPSSPSQTFALPRALLPELHRYKDSVRCAALGMEVSGHRQQQLTQTLIVRLLKTHFFTPILDCEKSTE